METVEEALEQFNRTGADTPMETIRVPTTFLTKDGRTYRATEREIKFVEILHQNPGKSLAEIARMAGYGAGMAGEPSQIMESKGVMALMQAAGSQLEDRDLLKLHVDLSRAGKIVKDRFPAFEPENGNGLQLVDDPTLKATLESEGCHVIGITTLSNAEGAKYREVRMKVPTYEYRDRALDKAYLIKGSYAPKKLDTKAENVHVHISLTDLRRAARERGWSVLDPVKTKNPDLE